MGRRHPVISCTLQEVLVQHVMGAKIIGAVSVMNNAPVATEIRDGSNGGDKE